MDGLQQEETTHSTDNERVMIQIPQCCREGWDTCPHVLQKAKRKKFNIGL